MIRPYQSLPGFRGTVIGYTLLRLRMRRLRRDIFRGIAHASMAELNELDARMSQALGVRHPEDWNVWVASRKRRALKKLVITMDRLLSRMPPARFRRMGLFMVRTGAARCVYVGVLR